ncbi:hypothetical protein SLEP1_g25228 [Rubroshorea leprosula]|uniref:Uncharacterized protein n=1 Tax=Rubroshorea leprosula TaxID=152421 RepID=A0AAV5JSP4_9ROSI|nr:hypothetical protein SLEP1_g25228 [Rubroshorea leprosula]
MCGVESGDVASRVAMWRREWRCVADGHQLADGSQARLPRHLRPV